MMEKEINVCFLFITKELLPHIAQIETMKAITHFEN